MQRIESTERILRDKALSRSPNIPRDSSEYLVAVAPHLKTPDECLPTDFTWIKCRAKHTISKIRDVYTQKVQTEVDICLGALKYPLTTQLSSLDGQGDRIIVLQAVALGSQHNASPAVPAVREPLRPVNDSAILLKPADVLGGISNSLLKPEVKSPTILTTIQSHARHVGAIPEFEAKHSQPSSSSPYGSSYHAPSQIKREVLSFGNSFSLPIKQNEKEDLRAHFPPPYTHHIQPSAAAPPAQSIPSPNAARNERLKRILADSSPEPLEAEVQSGVSLLEKFKVSLAQMAVQSPGAQQWLHQIEAVKQRNVNELTIIGVVGNTGAGKSSVINAMLDEERLVPTNCMRACTAVVTELSWNPSDDPNTKYRAEIEFIKPDDWEKELRILFEELLDGNGKVSRDSSNEDSEAGIAYAKIKSVYPKLTKDDIADTNVGELMRQQSVRNVLGTTKTVEEARSERFYRVLQSYVDSKEKSTSGDKKKPREMEYWPLIKVVKIFTKADALSTGAMVVDLPGVHDSNAARSAIAQNYMKMCTGLWIVAPITRAVDDKAAKSLLGESFKRQLKYDGTYSRVTFICSKTDDISITEASDSLGLEEEMSTKWQKFDQIERDQKILKTELAKLRESKSVYGEVLSNTDDELEVWDKLREDLEDGKTVYAPSGKSKKRRRLGRPDNSRKKTSQHVFDSENESHNDISDESDVETDPTSQGEPLQLEAIDERITDLKTRKKEARLQRRELDSRIKNLNQELEALGSSLDEIEAEMSAICIAGRNQYSKGAIQQDFAAGIKELDQENLAEDDEANFNPDEDIRDYEEVARSLPVFCVSSRAYQKLSGRLQRDKGVPGFKSVGETEIPQLQAHCKKLTEAGRAATCRRFLNAYSQLVNSLALWASNDGTSVFLSDAQLVAEGTFLQERLSQLGKGLEKSVQDCLAEMKESLAKTIYDRFDHIIEAAVDQANITATKWGAPVNRENRSAGGYLWATYKAICRRNGVYSNSFGTHDFNAQLTEPLLKQLGTDWEKAFARRLPSVLQSFQRSSKTLLQSFHEDVEAHTLKTGSGLAGLAMLGQQLQNYEAIFQDLTAQMIQIINEHQRDANREFTPVIARHLASAYEYCTDVCGSGSYLKMKLHMTQHVDERRKIMFKESTSAVRDLLNQMCRKVEEEMMSKADEVFVLMRRDYMNIITGVHIPQGQAMPNVERHARSEIFRIIQDMEERAEKGEGYDEEARDNQEKSESPAFEDARDIRGKPADYEEEEEGDPTAQIKAEDESAMEVGDDGEKRSSNEERVVKPEPTDDEGANE